MRTGVIGCGDWGLSRYVRVLWHARDVTDLVCVDPRPEAIDRLALHHPGLTHRPSLATALDDVDAVIIVAPADRQAELALEAIEAGKHVLVERPMAATLSDAYRVTQAAEAAGVVLATGHTALHEDGVRHLAHLVAGGDLGRLHHVRGASLGLGPYRSGVNALWDRGIGEVAVATLLLGGAPESVAAWGDRHTTGFAEDVVTLRMSYGEGDATASVRASWLDPEDVQRTIVVGSEKMVVRDNLDPASPIRVFDRGRRIRLRLGSDEPSAICHRDAGVEVPYVPHRDPLTVQIRRFFDDCQAGTRPVVDGWFGLTIVAILEAANQSLNEGGYPVPVDLPGRGDLRSLAVA